MEKREKLHLIKCLSNIELLDLYRDFVEDFHYNPHETSRKMKELQHKMSKLDSFDNSKAKCVNCGQHFEILYWSNPKPIKDRGLGGSIKDYNFVCKKCKHSYRYIINTFRADKITEDGFFFSK